MQVVIDIDDEIYERLRNSEVLVSGLRSGKTFLSKVCMAVANGIPLGVAPHEEYEDKPYVIEEFNGDFHSLLFIKPKKERQKKWKKID
jgi:hypothetical protein